MWSHRDFTCFIRFSEIVYVTVGNPAFCLALYFTGVYFRGELQPFSHVDGQKIKCQPFRTQKISGVRMQEELYVHERIKRWQFAMDSFIVLLSMWIKLHLRKINNFSSGMRVFTVWAGQYKLYQNESSRRRGWIKPRGSRV